MNMPICWNYMLINTDKVDTLHLHTIVLLAAKL